jgi:hypothetical protein
MTRKYYIRLNEKYFKEYDDKTFEFITAKEDATIFKTAEETKTKMEEIAITSNLVGNLRLIEENAYELLSINLYDKTDTISLVIMNQKNKIQYDTLEKPFKWIKETYEERFKDLKPHQSTEFLDKMLADYPANIITIKGNRVSYARTLKTAIDFVDGRIPLSGNYIPTLKGVMFEDLSDYFKDQFLEYMFKIRIFTRSTEKGE